MMTEEKLICEHISVSRKQLWSDCQAKYRFRYHLKIVPDEPPQPYFTYGKLVHKIAEVYVEHKGKTKIDDIAKDCLSGDIEVDSGLEGPLDIDKSYLKKLNNHIKNIKSFTDQIGFDGKLEYLFKYDLDPPNKCYVTGVIDRLIIRGDKFFIIDYKTTKKGFWRKNKNTIRKDLQLRCYAKVAQNQFGAQAENIRAALYYVDGPELVATKFTQESLDTAQQDLLETYLQIKSTNVNDVYGRVGDQCRRCEYRKMCPFYSLT